MFLADYLVNSPPFIFFLFFFGEGVYSFFDPHHLVYSVNDIYTHRTRDPVTLRRGQLLQVLSRIFELFFKKKRSFYLNFFCKNPLLTHKNSIRKKMFLKSRISGTFSGESTEMSFCRMKMLGV